MHTMFPGYSLKRDSLLHAIALWLPPWAHHVHFSANADMGRAPYLDPSDANDPERTLMPLGLTEFG